MRDSVVRGSAEPGVGMGGGVGGGAVRMASTGPGTGSGSGSASGGNVTGGSGNGTGQGRGGPGDGSGRRPGPAAAPVRNAVLEALVVAPLRGFGLSLLALGGSLALFIITVCSLALMFVGIGVLTTPRVLAAVRAHANLRRSLARSWAGIDIAAPYRPLPPSSGGLAGEVERCLLLLRDPATWRDILWLLVDAGPGSASAALAAALNFYAVEGWVMALGVWHAVRGDYWYGFIFVEDSTDAMWCAVLATGLLLLGLVVNRQLVGWHFQITRSLLGPTHGAQLAERVERLYETRHDAVDTSAAELRRIERDLHDGAQARMVAMGMSLGTIEALIEQDPAQAKRLIAQARANSAEALTELRDLVRGIHPPVLAERGLGDATKALALRMQMPVDVDIDLPGRFEEPVESAAYFAVSEILTNAVKHSGAGQVWIDIHYSHAAGGMLRIAVTDDGEGGADIEGGSGMAGIERRLGQFDGVLAVSSPPGGPTMVTMEIPCPLLLAD